MYKLLIADDEYVEREAIECVVKEYFNGKFEVRQAENGRQAVEAAVSFEPDIAFMDIKMPVLSGIDAARQILEQNPDCRVIMLTGFTYFNYAKESVSLGAMDFLVKPAPEEKIAETLERAMKQSDEMKARKSESRMAIESKELAERYLEAEFVSAMAFSGLEELAPESLPPALKQMVGGAVAAAVSLFDDRGGIVTETAVLQRCAEGCRDFLQQTKGLRALFCVRYGRIFLAVISDKKQSDEQECTLFYEMLQRLKENGFNAAVCVGTRVDTAGQLQLSFAEARRIDPRCAEVTVFCPQLLHRYAGAEQYQLEEQLCECLSHKQYSDAVLLLNRLLQHIFADGNSVKVRVYELLVVLNRAVRQRAQVDPTHPLWEKLEGIEGNEQLREFGMSYLQRMIDRLIASETTDSEKWSDAVVAFVKAEYQNNITLEDAAQSVGLSTYYFSRSFKQAFGKTFVEYLTAVRIEQAKKLLKSGGASVKSVCLAVGYSEPNYFGRVFKREVGLTPSEYQRQSEKSAGGGEGEPI